MFTSSGQERFMPDANASKRSALGDAPASTLPRLHNVLVCSDFSHASTLAVERAVEFCRTVQSHLSILHVFETGAADQFADAHTEQLCQQALTEAREKLNGLFNGKQDHDVSVDLLIRHGLPALVIAELVSELQIDIVFLGTNGFRRLERLIFGSTAEAVLRNASCPVVTVGPQSEVTRHTGKGNGPVVFATDFQEPATDAIACAAAMAKLHKRPLHCLHVLPLSMETADKSQIVAQIMTQALRRLAKEECGMDPLCAVVYGSEIAHAIVDYAKKEGAQMIVLGVRRAFALAAHLPPQIAYRIVVTAPCPVLSMSYKWMREPLTPDVFGLRR
jgi:nucleotide-binding universal stress UspA family protein